MGPVRVRVWIATAMLGASLVALAPESAGATAPPVAVSFDVRLTFTNPSAPPCTPTTPCTAEGTFTNGTGPLCRSGSAFDVFVFPGGQRDRTYVCADGSGSLFMQVQYRRFFPGPDPDTFLITGFWEIVGGTGPYAHVHGHGQVTSIFVPDPGGSLAETNTGEVVASA